MKFLKIAIIIFFIGSLFCTTAHATKYITLPNNQQFDISNLSDEEIKQLIKLSQKSSSGNEETITDIVGNMDPASMNEWRQLITGTIKDICDDLNVTVNEFIKTPAGMGISTLIVYKIAGKELLSSFISIILAIPLWFVITAINGILMRHFFSFKVVYKNISQQENDKGKLITIKDHPERISRYIWKSEDAKVGLAWGLGISQIAITILCVAIVFFKI